MDIKILVGERIRTLRKRKGLTLDQLADVTNINPGYISAIERGARNISVETLQRLANALEVKPIEILRFNCTDTVSDSNKQKHIEKIVERLEDESIEVSQAIDLLLETLY